TPLIEKIGRAHLRFAQEVLLERGDQFSRSRCVGLGRSANDHDGFASRNTSSDSARGGSGSVYSSKALICSRARANTKSLLSAPQSLCSPGFAVTSSRVRGGGSESTWATTASAPRGAEKKS